MKSFQEFMTTHDSDKPHHVYFKRAGWQSVSHHDYEKSFPSADAADDFIKKNPTSDGHRIIVKNGLHTLLQAKATH